MTTDSLQIERQHLMKRTSFTIQEANQTIVLVSRITNDINDTWGILQEEHRLLGLLEKHPDVDGAKVEEKKNEIRAKVAKFNELVAEVEALGASVEQYANTIISFPFQKGSKICQLIYRHGESRVTEWKWPHNNLEQCGPITYDK